MTRYLVVSAFTLVALLSSTVHAQRFGILGGKSNSDVVVIRVGGGSYPDRPGNTFGISYRRPLRERLLLQPELLLVERGWGTNSRPTLSLSYVEVPVLFRYGTPAVPGGWPRPTLFGGPTASLATKCELSGVGITQVDGSGCNQRIVAPFSRDYRVRRFDVGALVGIGVEAVSRCGTVVGVDGRYELGMLDLLPGEPGRSRNSTKFLMVHVVPRMTRCPPRDGESSSSGTRTRGMVRTTKRIQP